MNKKLALIVALAVVGVFAAVVVFNSDVEETTLASTILRYPTKLRETKNLTSLFKKWKIQYNKTYGGVEHEKRYNIFVDNFKRIEKINSQKKRFTVGLNQFADLTKAEFSSLYLGLKHKKNVIKTRPALDDEVEIEDLKIRAGSVDWRTKGAVTPIKNQGQCGSCWAFSSTGSLEGLAFLKTGKLQSFSEQQLVDCSGSYGNEGCNGGLMESALQYTADQGIELESTYPYTGEDGTCSYSASKVVFKNKGYTAANGDAALEKAVNIGPVSVSVEADQDVFQYYTSGVLDSADCGTNLDHGVLAVGYGTTGGQGYWIVKNSWGTSWGDQGYLKIARSTGDGICGINLDNCYPTA